MPQEYFLLKVTTIGNEILETPVDIPVPCDQAIIMGMTTLKDFDSIVENIVAINVLLIKCGNQIYGTSDYQSVASFMDYMHSKCVCCADGGQCGLVLNSCMLVLNGCSINLN